MKQRARKFVGIWLMLALLIIYPLVVIVIYSEQLMWLPVWASLIFFLIFGLFWAVPAGMIIKWMSRPDPE
ncbi:MAG: DUF2842 domain-containing protein [Devosiaceae bacterium]|nr:DUF2842 domain-containing protein [Devosiaceae bacterium]